MKKQITLKEYIKLKGLSQADAAAEIGISRTYLNLVLSGKKPAGRPLCVKLAHWSQGRINLAPLMMIPS